MDQGMEEGQSGEQAGEQAEDQALQQILQLAKSDNCPSCQKIAQIVEALIAHNQEEEAQMGGDGAEQPDKGQANHDAMVAAVKKQYGQE